MSDSLIMCAIYFRLAVKEVSHQSYVEKLGLNYWRLTVPLFRWNL